MGCPVWSVRGTSTGGKSQIAIKIPRVQAGQCGKGGPATASWRGKALAPSPGSRRCPSGHWAVAWELGRTPSPCPTRHCPSSGGRRGAACLPPASGEMCHSHRQACCARASQHAGPSWGFLCTVRFPQDSCSLPGDQPQSRHRSPCPVSAEKQAVVWPARRPRCPLEDSRPR